MVSKQLAKLGLSQRAFAAKVQMTQPHVAQLIGGVWPITEERIPIWTEVLELKGAEAEEFRIQALLTRCPEEIRTLVAKLRAEPRTRRSP